MYSTQLKKPAVYDCPETGLETVQYPAWPEEAADAPFTLEVRVIAGRIIHIQSSGTPSPAAMRQGFRFINRIRLAHIPEGLSFAVIEDMSRIGGISIEARKEYIHAIRTAPRIKGVIFYNANAMQKFMVRLAKLGQKFPFPLLVSHHYAHAIELAWSVLGESAAAGDPAVSAACGPLPKMIRLQPEGPTVLTHPEWRLERDTFQTDFKVIDGNILYSTSSGVLTADMVSEIAALREKVLLEAPAGTHFQYIVADITRLAGGGWRARQEYIHSLKQWHSRFPFTAYIVFGSNRFMRIAVRLAGMTLPFKTALTENLDSALAEIRRMSAPGPRPGDAPRSASPLSGTSSGSDIGSYVEELLNSLAGFTWNVPDPVDVAPCPNDHPFKPVFEAMHILNLELKDLFQERRLAEDALKASEARYRLIMDTAQEMIITLDLTGRPTLINPAALQATGYGMEEAMAMNIRQILPPESLEQLTASLALRLQGDATRRRHEIDIISRDGRRIPVETSTALLTDKDVPSGVLIIARNISERKQAEQERMLMEERMRTTQRLESVGLLAGGVAHDFNNVLTGILGHATLLQLSLHPSHPGQRHFQDIETLVNRASGLTRQLLGFARAGKYEAKPTQLNHLVLEAAKMFGQTRKDIRIHQDHPPDLPLCLADQGQMDQVLMNLFINAGHAMPAGGDLYLNTQYVDLDDARAGCLSVAAGRYIRLTVRDTGAGIEKFNLPKIFDPFFTTREFGKGSGLGLASVYGIIKNHDGAIDVDSKPGQGTTFCIFLPVSSGPQMLVPPSLHLEEVHGSGTLLLVDDEDMVREVAVMMLEYLGYTVIPAAGGKEAVSVYQRQRDQIDLVILDMIMPDMTGAQTFDALKRLNPKVRVLLSSGFSAEGQAAEILQRGCRGFIQKPFQMAALSLKIKESLADFQGGSLP